MWIVTCDVATVEYIITIRTHYYMSNVVCHCLQKYESMSLWNDLSLNLQSYKYYYPITKLDMLLKNDLLLIVQRFYSHELWSPHPIVLQISQLSIVLN